jgi:acetylornithine deacetylase/succinyl-diaminopimelate desuccinylase-like protein
LPLADITAARRTLALDRTPDVAAIARRLIAAASPNPPGDTRTVAKVAAACIREAVPSAEVALHESAEGIVNVVARVRGAEPGRRVILNGHLDTYPIGEPDAWSVDPTGATVDERLYGRGAADMKGGIAASIVALAGLASVADAWPGEVVLTLAGDEESMGPLGTQWLLDTVPHATGDAAIIGDAGSPRVLRFGEKGFLWIEVEATGRPAHGAHVHLGDNAIDRLRRALDRLEAALAAVPVAAPAAVSEAIARSRRISEPLAGVGEAETLGRITINLGRIEGGTSPNLIPARARAALDIRLPVGVAGEAVEAAIHGALDDPHLSIRVLRNFAPNHTDPNHPLVRHCAAAAEEVLGSPIAVNMRVGGSDARWFRMRGIPTVVYGPTPHGMGGPDEFAVIAELGQVARVHALTAFDFLSETQP